MPRAADARHRRGRRGAGSSRALQRPPREAARRSAGRSQFRTFHAWFAQSAAHARRWRCSNRSACRPDMPAARGRRRGLRAPCAGLSCRGAARCRACAPTTARWSRRAAVTGSTTGSAMPGTRRVEFALADATGTRSKAAWCPWAGVVPARGPGRPGAAGRRLLRGASGCCALAAGWPTAQTRPPRDAAAQIGAAYTLPTPRAVSKRAFGALITRRGARCARTCPSSPALAQAGAFQARLHDAGRAARGPPPAPAHGPALLARCSPRSPSYKRAHGFADMADLERRAHWPLLRDGEPGRLGAGAARRCASGTC